MTTLATHNRIQRAHHAIASQSGSQAAIQRRALSLVLGDLVDSAALSPLTEARSRAVVRNAIARCRHDAHTALAYGSRLDADLSMAEADYLETFL